MQAAGLHADAAALATSLQVVGRQQCDSRFGGIHLRSLLFVPGDSPRKLAKGMTSGADALIIDLEDSVSADRKAAARTEALAFLREISTAKPRPYIIVRVN